MKKVSFYFLREIIDVDDRHTIYYNLNMKYFKWSNEKNKQFMKERNVSFEIFSLLIESGNVMEIVKHPNQEKYANQFIFIVEYNDYAYLAPFVEDEKEIFLKTIIPSRKATKKYLRK